MKPRSWILFVALGCGGPLFASVPPRALVPPSAPPRPPADEVGFRDIERLLRTERQRLSLETDVERLQQERDRLEAQKRRLEAERAQIEAESARLRERIESAGPGLPDSATPTPCMALVRAPLSQQGVLVREAPPMTIVHRIAGAAGGRIRIRWDGAEYEANASDFAPESLVREGLAARIQAAESELARRRAERDQAASAHAAADCARLDAEIGILEDRRDRARAALDQILEAFRTAAAPTTEKP